MLRVAAVAFTAGALLFAASARASDGVLEINQACAEQTGCFPGDSAGFPVTIGTATGGRSFRMTSDLLLADSNTTAISVNGVRATIDLAGFVIEGVTTCTLDAVTTATTCAPLGAGVGILESGGSVVVHGGAIGRMGNHGIKAGNFCVVRDMMIAGNGGSGVSAAYECLIENNQISVNQIDGVSLLGSHSDVSSGASNGGVSRVRGNTFTNNGRDGVAVEVISQIENNLFTSNDRYGLNGLVLITYSGNLFTANGVGQVNGQLMVNSGGNTCAGVGCP